MKQKRTAVLAVAALVIAAVGIFEWAKHLSYDTMVDIMLTMVWIVAVAVTAFPLLYFMRSQWSATRTGKSILAFSVAVALLVDLTLVSYHFDEWLTVERSFTVQLLAWIYTLWATGYVLVGLWRAQTDDRSYRLRRDDTDAALSRERAGEHHDTA